MSVRAMTWSWLLAPAAAAFAPAATLRPVGALGNSGETGPALVRVGRSPFDHSASGVAMDDDWTLWLSGGDVINRVGLDGRLIERFPLEPEGSVVDSKTFAVLNRRLYFLGRLADGQVRLFELLMEAGEGDRAARPLALQLPARKRDYVSYCLAPQPLNGQLVIVTEPEQEAEARIGVYLVSPDSDPADVLRPAFTLPGEYPGGVAVDEERGLMYIGASFGLFVGGETHSNLYALTAVRPDGSVVSDAFPVACTKTPAIPTQFRGVISLAGGALWDTAWYGFVSRLDLQGRGAPGRIVQWHHELGYPTQVLGIDQHSRPPERQLLCVTTAMPDAFYLARWDEADEALSFVRRIGCLPVISSLGLSEDGWVTVGTARTQLWWRWDDAADFPPRKAELHIAVTPVHWGHGRFFALAAQYRLDDLDKQNPVGTIFTSRLGDRNEAHRVTEPVPIRRPVGLSVGAAPGQDNAALFVTDADAKQIQRTGFWLPELRPDNDKWQAVAVTDTVLEMPTDVAALTDGRLLVADQGRILLLAPDGDEYRVERQFDQWGVGPEERFGGQLRFAVDGSWMLVSDTDRHRIVWLDWTDWQVLAQLGETDSPGDGALHLNSPTLVALKGTRAVVADRGNQRVVKLTLTP